MRDRQRQQKLKEFETLCRQQGLPVTVQRRVILETLLDRDDHPTADQILEAVQGRIPGVSRTTVYRVLDTLVGIEVIRRVQQTGPPARFDAKTRRHHHLVCVHCNRMADLEAPELDRLPLPKARPKGFEISDYTVQFIGTCSECREKR